MDQYQLEDLQREARVMSTLLNEQRVKNFRHQLTDDNIMNMNRIYSNKDVISMVNPYNL